MNDDLFSVVDRHIIVTGATGLVGGAISTALAARGAKLTLVGTNDAKLHALSDRLTSAAGNIPRLRKVDIGSKSEVALFATEINSSDLPVHGVIHCAMARPGQRNLRHYEDAFENSIAANAVSSFLLWDAFAKHMAKNGGGSLVYINSIYGTIAPDFDIYEGTNMGTEPDYMFIKSGMNGLSRYYASKFGKFGVRSNSLVLGGVANNQPESFRHGYVKKTSLQRMAEPEDVIGACVYLVSDASRYVTGSEIRVEGGYLAR